MNQIELNSMGLSELKANETREINGGWWRAALAVAGAAIYIYNESPDFIRGIKEGFAAQQG